MEIRQITEYIDADYSQVELRVLAHISQDENMIHAFKTGLEKPSEKQKAAVRKTNEKKRKRVVRTMGDEKNEYESATVAAIKNNVGISTICRYCNKKRMPKDGASWQYVEDLGEEE